MVQKFYKNYCGHFHRYNVKKYGMNFYEISQKNPQKIDYTVVTASLS